MGGCPSRRLKCRAASSTHALRRHLAVVCGCLGLCPRPSLPAGPRHWELNTSRGKLLWGPTREPVVEQFQHTRHHRTVGKPHYQSRRGGQRRDLGVVTHQCQQPLIAPAPPQAPGISLQALLELLRLPGAVPPPGSLPHLHSGLCWTTCKLLSGHAYLQPPWALQPGFTGFLCITKNSWCACWGM